MGGLAACALALAGVTAALVPDLGSVPGNHIAAGHLAVQVNHGEGGDLNFRNLVPGEQRSGDQVVSVDMAGMGSADLTLQMAASDPGPLAEWTSLTVYYSDPEPSSSVGWSGGTCTPAGGYRHHVGYPALGSWSGRHELLLGVVTAGGEALCVRYQMTVDPKASNDVQGADVSVEMTYVVEQTSAAGP